MKLLFVCLVFLGLSASLKAQFVVDWVQAECDTPVTGYSRLEDLHVDDSGFVFVNGTIDTLEDVSPVYLSYAPNGTPRWRKTMRGGFNLNFSYRMLSVPNGNVVSAGEYEDQSGTNNMVFIEHNKAGDSLSGGVLNAPGFTTGDDLHDAATDSEGNLFLAGQIRVGTSFPAAVARFDYGGKFRWLTSHPILPGWSFGMVRGIEMCGDTGIYLLIFNASGFGTLAYCDTAGTFRWQRPLPIGLAEFHTQLTVDGAGNALAAGRIQSRGALVKVNPAGDTLWTKTISFPGLAATAGSAIQVKTDSLNRIYTLTSNGNNPYYTIVSAFLPDGQLQWSDTSRGLATLYSRNKEFFEVKGQKITFATNRGRPWLYQYHTDGTRLTSQELVLAGFVNPEVSALRSKGNTLYLAGTGQAGFNIRRGFVAQLTQTTTHIPGKASGTELNPVPNPACGTFRIPGLSRGQVVLFSSWGQPVRNWKAEGPDQIFALKGLPPGIYQVWIQSGTQVGSRRLVVR